MELHKVALATTFGHDSEHPLRAALVRLGSLWIAAVGLSWLIGGSLTNLALPHAENTLYLARTAVMTIQITVLFVLLAAWSIIGDNTSTFGRLLLLWPISPLKRWVLLLLPSLVLSWMAITLVSIPLGILLVKAGAHPLLLVSAPLVGTMAAYGIAYGVPRRHAWVHIIDIPALLWLEYHATPLLFSLLLLALCLLFVYSTIHMTHDGTHTHQKSIVRTAWIPPCFWFVKKFWRASSARSSFCTTLLLSAGLAILLSRQPETGRYMAALLAPVLAASFASDIRTLSRQSRPAEVTALRGTRRFMMSYLVKATIGSIAAV
ncbi:MAG: hypothetical protein AAB834_06625 [Patescibacteria group bacterium]